MLRWLADFVKPLALMPKNVGSTIERLNTYESFPDHNPIPVERHPFEPFLPANAKVLMLGSFPPQSKRWSIDFYYPNFINDMWRIMGLIFFNDKNRFVDVAAKKFRLDDIVDFCTGTGIAMYDTATAVRRLKDNASDKFLEVVTPTDIPALLRQIPQCQAIVTTGEKATDTLCQTFWRHPTGHRGIFRIPFRRPSDAPLPHALLLQSLPPPPGTESRRLPPPLHRPQHGIASIAT